MVAVALTTAGCGAPATTGAISGYVVKFAGARGASGDPAGAMAVIPTPTPGVSPVAGAYVQYDGPSGFGFTMAGVDGGFYIGNLTPGPYTVNISHPDFIDSYQALGQVSAGATWNVGTRRLGSVRILAIGINDYQYIGDLNGAVPDAEMLFNALATDNLLANEAWILKNEQATREGIRLAIQAIGSGMAAGDTFIMTYAGHGTRSLDGQTEYIIPYDYNHDYGYGPTEAISDIQLDAWLDEYVTAGTGVYIFDSCNSGGMASAATFVPRGMSLSTSFEAMARNISATNRVVMTAATKAQESYEFSSLLMPDGTFETHGIFAYGVAKGMWAASGYPADNNMDYSITCYEAFNHANNVVASKLAEPLPPNPGAQTPQLFDLGNIATSTYIFSY